MVTAAGNEHCDQSSCKTQFAFPMAVIPLGKI